MDIYTASEESYKRGFERGYTEGICDHAAELSKGAIRWHRAKPRRNVPHCLVVYRDADDEVVVSPGSYSELCDAFLIPQFGVLFREDFIMWGEIRKVHIDKPEIK